MAVGLHRAVRFVVSALLPQRLCAQEVQRGVGRGEHHAVEGLVQMVERGGTVTLCHGDGGEVAVHEADLGFGGVFGQQRGDGGEGAAGTLVASHAQVEVAENAQRPAAFGGDGQG